MGVNRVVDYNAPNLEAAIKEAAEGHPISIAIDVIAVESSLQTISSVVGPGSKVAVLFPVKLGSTTITGPIESEMLLEFPEKIVSMFEGKELYGVRTFLYAEDESLRDTLMPKVVPHLLKQGLVKPNPVRLVNQGTMKERVEIGLDLLRNNKVSGEKVVVEVV